MKFNIEVTVDWLEEGGDIDQVVKQEIIDGVTSRIENKLLAEARKELEDRTYKELNTKIDEIVDREFQTLWSKPIVQCDRWGDTLKEYPSGKAMIKEKFDNFLTEQVDGNGKPATNYSSNRQTRVHYIIDRQLKQFSDKFTKETVEKVSEELKKYTSDAMKHAMGQEMMDLLKIDKKLGLDAPKKPFR
ncbi:hypothetical protein KMW28_27025 [Flammeovirga yaeyamensis]|uniref:Uncharacterized protein n=1 Tax=Flammeovirga yaeyamensis TaxID=367791 RepID=A0AAX1NF00_9BACT|nr:hypothetical protein [Flammeovirga yaeyamensis]MBB3700070.1 uncharacterized protein YbcI [Flammeovirga yaeyamensis]NMF37496.1 hypothetical protein [Flammeovirga yaeyamensis]QWG04553.1 hypothetical protein KMW28_27025 [Flammeovirga yaeyamensis]